MCFFPYIVSTIIDDVYNDDAIALILLEYPLTYRVTLGVQLTPEKLCAYNVRFTIDPLFISGMQSTKTPAMVAGTTFMFKMGVPRANVIQTEME